MNIGQRYGRMKADFSNVDRSGAQDHKSAVLGCTYYLPGMSEVD